MKIFFYGRLADTVGREIDLTEGAPSSVGGLKRQLAATFPDMAEMLHDGRVKALIGESFVADDHALSPHDEVEFLAPVSGG